MESSISHVLTLRVACTKFGRDHTFGSGDMLAVIHTDRHTHTHRCAHYNTCHRSRGPIMLYVGP